jgi:hypothetical protein
VIADVAGLLSLNLRGRSLGIVPIGGCLGHGALHDSFSSQLVLFLENCLPTGEFGGNLRNLQKSISRLSCAIFTISSSNISLGSIRVLYILVYEPLLFVTSFLLGIFLIREDNGPTIPLKNY